MITAETRAKILQSADGKCQCCGISPRGYDLHLHHIVDTDYGGTDDAENLVALCRWCHNLAHNKHQMIKLVIKPDRTFEYVCTLDSIKNTFRRLETKISGEIQASFERGYAAALQDISVKRNESIPVASKEES